MNKFVVAVSITVIALAVLVVPTIIQGVYYGLRGVPLVRLLSPACNGTAAGTLTFSWSPEPQPYHHYRLQVRAGEDWEVDDLIAVELADTSYPTTLEPGIYMYNVIAFSEANESQAGSSPCRFTVQ